MSESWVYKYLAMALVMASVFTCCFLLGRRHQRAICLSRAAAAAHNNPSSSRLAARRRVESTLPLVQQLIPPATATLLGSSSVPCGLKPDAPPSSTPYMSSSSSSIRVIDTCTAPLKKIDDSIYLYSNDISNSAAALAQFGSFTSVESRPQSVNDIVFGTLHHPPSPSKVEYILINRPYPVLFESNNDINNNNNNYKNSSSNSRILKGNIFEDYCSSIISTKSGSRITHTNKCLAVVQVFSGQEENMAVSHRIGSSPGLQKNLTNRYQDDHIDYYGFQEEFVFLKPLLINRDELVRNLSSQVLKVHPYLKKDHKTNSYDKTLVVMVANTGVIDLLINFACSLKKASPSISYLLKSMLVFVTDLNMASVVSQLDMIPFYCGDSCGTKPGGWETKAAANYGDGIFGKLMWFKTVSVYLPLAAGFNVLFQDVDMVWMRDPIPYLERFNKGMDMTGFEEMNEDGIIVDNSRQQQVRDEVAKERGRGISSFYDMTFMDDGSRTPRFSPLFVNSGFYYMRYSANSIFFMEKMLKASGEITQTHSHQATMTRHLSELLEVSTLKINVLERRRFPSGSMFHHDKTYIDRMMKKEIHPYVFHMCWTASRDEKVKYLREMNMWHISDTINMTDILRDTSILLEMDGEKLCK